MESSACPYISVVVPAYNESDKISITIERINDFFQKKSYPFEIIVVDDASKDNTFAITSNLAGKYPQLKSIRLEKNGRKAGAVKAGMLSASGQFVLSTDADLATSIDQVDKLFEPVINGGYDIAIGSRGLRFSKLLVSQSYFRKMLGKLYGFLVNVLLVRGVVDTQCGFKLYRREIVKELFNQLTSEMSVFEIEILINATRHGYRVVEVPVIWSHNPDTRLKYNILSSLKVFWELIRLKTYWKILLPYKINN